MEIRKELHVSTALPSGFTAGNQLTGDWVCWSERDGEKKCAPGGIRTPAAQPVHCILFHRKWWI
jgi:hypothetical protein